MYRSNDITIDNIDVPDEFIEITSLLKLNKNKIKRQMLMLINNNSTEEQEESWKKTIEIINYSIFLDENYYRSFFINILGEALCVKKTISAFIASIIELLHCQTIMQNAMPYIENEDYRYNKETCHKRFGNSETMIATTILISMIIEIIVDNNETSYEVRCKIIKILTKYIGKNGVNGWQIMKLMMKKKCNHTSDEENRIRKLKFNSLFNAGAECLEFFAKTTETQSRNIVTYIHNLCNLMHMHELLIKNKSSINEILERTKLFCKQGENSIIKIKNNEKLISFLRYCKYCIEKIANEKRQKKPAIVNSDIKEN